MKIWPRRRPLRSNQLDGVAAVPILIRSILLTSDLEFCGAGDHASHTVVLLAAALYHVFVLVLLRVVAGKRDRGRNTPSDVQAFSWGGSGGVNLATNGEVWSA